MRPDELIDALAATHNDVVARVQLLTAGVSRQGIDRRVGSGRLQPVHPASTWSAATPNRSSAV